MVKLFLTHFRTEPLVAPDEHIFGAACAAPAFLPLPDIFWSQLIQHHFDQIWPEVLQEVLCCQDLFQGVVLKQTQQETAHFNLTNPL